MRETVDVDDIRLGPSTDYLALVREQLKDGSVWPSDGSPEEGLWRAIDVSKGTAVQQKLLDATIALLKDPDLAVRTRAIATLPNYAPEIDLDAIVASLRDHPELYEGIKPRGVPESYMPDLSWGLIQTLTASPKSTPDSIRLLRKRAMDPQNGFRVLGGLAAKDPDWVIEQANNLISGEPVRAGIVLPNLTTANRRERFIAALASGTASFRRALAGIINDEIKDAGERQRLAALVA